MSDIHPTALIDDNVKMGKNNKILPYTIIQGPAEIGDDNIIGPNVVVGSPGQDTKNRYYDSSNCLVKIGSRNIIREFTAIQKPSYEEITILGNDIFLMQSVHIPHDAQLFDKVVVSPMCTLAGISRILEGANIGMGATINQYCVIGQYSIVAMGAAVMKNVKPFSRYIPNKPTSVNSYAVKKFGFEEFKDEIEAYVMEDAIPTSLPIKNITNFFLNKHTKSKRDLYI